MMVKILFYLAIIVAISSSKLGLAEVYEPVIREIVENALEEAVYTDSEPMPLSDLRPTFYLFTAKHRGGQFCGNAGYNFKPEKLEGEHYFPSPNRTGELIVIIHGYQGYICGEDVMEWASPVIDSFLTSQPDSSVIFVDWELGAFSLMSEEPYPQTVANARIVGRAVADFLLTGRGARCIGMEVGAHVCGFAGQHFEEREPGLRWSRITGISPAKAGFLRRPANERLSPDDADLVEVF